MKAEKDEVFVSLLKKEIMNKVFSEGYFKKSDLINYMNIFLYRLELLNFHSVLPFEYEDVVKEFKRVFGEVKK